MTVKYNYPQLLIIADSNEALSCDKWEKDIIAAIKLQVWNNATTSIFGRKIPWK